MPRFITSDEADELREAGEAIGMAAEGVVVMVDQFRAARDEMMTEEERVCEDLGALLGIPPTHLAVQILYPDTPYYCGGTTLTGQDAS